MDQPIERNQGPDLRDSLAAERTFLAWIRTGLALRGFGFVVERLGVFVQQLQVIQKTHLVPAYGLSLWFGIGLIAVGMVVFLLSAWHHLRLIEELNRGGPLPSRPSKQAVAIAVFLALVGLAMTIYLVSVRGSVNRHYENNVEVSMTAATGNGIIDIPTNHSVEKTADRLKNILKSKEVPLFALIDHTEEAEKLALNMPPTKLLIFTNP